MCFLQIEQDEIQTQHYWSKRPSNPISICPIEQIGHPPVRIGRGRRKIVLTKHCEMGKLLSYFLR